MAVSRVDRMQGEDAVVVATGRTSEEWYAILDEAGAREWTHPRIVRELADEHGVAPWWRQNLTVRYEQARGPRVPGQQADGTFAAGASRTVDGAPADALALLVAAAEAEVGAAPRAVREHPERPNARWTLADGSTLLVSADPAGDRRSRVGVMLEKLATADDAGPAKELARRILDRGSGA